MDKIIKFIMDNKWLQSILVDWIPILLLTSSSILYPIWWINGNLDGDNIYEEIYLKVGVAVTSYGGLIANIIWLIRKR